jgi:hypothetical protein
MECDAQPVNKIDNALRRTIAVARTARFHQEILTWATLLEFLNP